ncbi:MAG: transposase [Chryseobacterium taeanense]
MEVKIGIKGTVNAIGAIHKFEMFNVCLFEGDINADVFHAWVTQEPLFFIPNNSVMVMDNATFNERKDSITAIEKN